MSAGKMQNLDHMEFLRTVTDSDVAVLQSKEQTYQGSWKRAGGRSAWFMARRNMDRLIEMMKKPDEPLGWGQEMLENVVCDVQNTCEGIGTRDRVSLETVRGVEYLRDCYVAENIFAKIREKPNGEDGTVLACMRDLRRYLVLVEAEMIARGVVRPEQTDGSPLPVPTVFTEVSNDRALPRMTQQAAYRERTPEDGGHHSGTFPWRRCSEPSPDEQWWYTKRAGGLYLLDPFVVASDIPESLRACYERVLPTDAPGESVWVLYLQGLPEDLREFYPRLQVELNAKEHDDCEERFMYRHDAGSGKYVLEPRYERAGWGREP